MVRRAILRNAAQLSESPTLYRHLGQHHPGQLPINRGFDHHFGYLGGAEDHYDNTNPGCGENTCGKKTDLWRDRGPATGEAGGEFAAYKYDREAVRIISTHDGATPLFIYYALQCAHAPNEPDHETNINNDKTSLSHFTATSRSSPPRRTSRRRPPLRSTARYRPSLRARAARGKPHRRSRPRRRG